MTSEKRRSWRGVLGAAAVLAAGLFLFNLGKVSSDQARTLVQQGALLLDVRSQEEFSSGHLKDAKNIPVQELEARLGELAEAKKQNIVVYCRSGTRSARAKRILSAAGFEAVHDLGAMWRWRD